MGSALGMWFQSPKSSINDSPQDFLYCNIPRAGILSYWPWWTFVHVVKWWRNVYFGSYAACKELWDLVPTKAGHRLNGCSQALCKVLEGNGKTIYLKTSKFLLICATAFTDITKHAVYRYCCKGFPSFCVIFFRMGITLVFNDLAFLWLLSSVSQCYLLSFCLT